MSTLRQASFPIPYFKLFLNGIGNGPDLRFNKFGRYWFFMPNLVVIVKLNFGLYYFQNHLFFILYQIMHQQEKKGKDDISLQTITAK